MATFRMTKNSSRNSSRIGRVDRVEEIRDTVDLPGNAGLVPLGGEDVEIVTERFVQRQVLREIGPAVREDAGIRDRIVAVMHGEMRRLLVRVEVVHLHDVDFTRPRPADHREIGAEHPERGPCTLADGRLYARLDLAVLERKLVQRRNAPRRDRIVALGAVRRGRAVRGYLQISAADCNVAGRTRVQLPFVVAQPLFP